MISKRMKRNSVRNPFKNNIADRNPNPTIKNSPIFYVGLFSFFNFRKSETSLAVFDKLSFAWH